MPAKPLAPREVAIANRHPRLRLDRRAVARVIHVLDAEFGQSKPENRKSKIPAGELSLVFLTDAALAQLHADFLDDPTPTDVITFEGDAALGTAGEICVSADAALRQIAGFAVPALAGKNADRLKAERRTRASHAHRVFLPPSFQFSSLTSSPAFSAELTLYLVHGWLHLAGYDDLVPAKKRAMRRAEARAMELLRNRDSLPRFKLGP